MRSCLIASAKDEGPYVLEWVAYHRLIGFNKLIVFQNNSTDGTDEILATLHEIGVVRYQDNSQAPLGRQQRQAYSRASALESVRRATWVMALDFDEFLLIDVGDGSLKALVDAVPDADEIIVNWRQFGNSGQVAMSDELQSKRFIQADPVEEIIATPIPYKTLFRPDFYGNFGVHRPVNPLKPETGTRVVNGSGLASGRFMRHRHKSTDPGMRRFAQVNHYAVRDAASYAVKSTRGSGNKLHKIVEHKYWTDKCRNDVADVRLANRSPEILAEMQRLDAASGGRLLKLTRAAVAKHHARFEDVLRQAKVRELYEFCCHFDGARANAR